MSKANDSLANLRKAVASLRRSLSPPPVEERDFAGIIQNFEFAYELTWKTLQAILREEGVAAEFPRLALEEAFKAGLLEGNEVWKRITEDRNLSTHTYDAPLAEELCQRIRDTYVTVFEKSLTRIETFRKRTPKK